LAKKDLSPLLDIDSERELSKRDCL